jgi:hypothetical protein
MVIRCRRNAVRVSGWLVSQFQVAFISRQFGRASPTIPQTVHNMRPAEVSHGGQHRRKA